MTPEHGSVETAATIVAKIAPPATVSIASVAGFQVSELLLWATLVYTVLMICHKLYSMVHDYTEHKREECERAGNCAEVCYTDRRQGKPDNRTQPKERRQL